VTAFEDGILERFADTLKKSRSPVRREQILAQVVATAPAGCDGRAPGGGSGSL
jgi:DNA topoisomerase-1